MNHRLQRFYEHHHATGNRLRQSFMERARAELFNAWIGSDKRILDLGCRDGALTRHLVYGNDVVGADIDQAALLYASRMYRIETRQIDLNDDLPFEDGSFDVVVMAEVLEHLPYPASTLQEIERVLKPDSLFIGNVPLAYHLKDRYRVLRGKKLTLASDPTHVQFYTYDDIHNLLTSRFRITDLKILKGATGARLAPRLLARNIAFRCVKSGGDNLHGDQACSVRETTTC
jgi:2-polyprenyl-3-methyl-5-hydroxy-6-metoxy-1,4-benzoquinol methylase